jgi:alpha-N-arabinofuranosidase
MILHNLFIFIVTLTCIIASGYAFGGDNNIVVFYNNDIGQINKKVIGTMFIGDDPAIDNNKLSHYYGRADYGSGIWNPSKNESVKEVIDLAKNAGISIVRFYNGNYPWKNTIGKGRKNYLFGMDEFLKTTEEIGSEPLILMNYFIDNEQDAADLVEYLNAPCDGKHPWAAKRAENGHPDPYKVKYFELGNEVYDYRFGVTPEEYAHRYLKFNEAMKAVDPSIQIGIVLYTNEVNRRMLQIVKDKADFGIIHLYPTPVWGNKLEQLAPFEVFSLSFALAPLNYEDLFRETLEFTKEITGKELPLAITEYNVGFGQEKPFPYRHSLGAALINAELLIVFMKQENKILMANQFHFSNDYFGMIKSEENFMMHDYRKPIHYIKRPTYYVYELYNNHFGDILIHADVQSGFYRIDGWEKYPRIRDIIENNKKGNLSGDNLLSQKWTIIDFPGVTAEEKNEILEIDFYEPDGFNYSHSLKKVTVQPNTYYRLSGYIKTEKLIDNVGVSLAVIDARGWVETHSNAVTEKIMGSNDWHYVHVLYKTLADAKLAHVFVSRSGKEGPLKGRVFIKDVKFERFEPDTRVQYLSVNASKSKDGDKVYLMVINKNLTENISAFVEIRDFTISKKTETTSNKNMLQAESWILNGPSVESTNEKKADNVKVVNKKFEINDASFEYIFEPHSLTVIEISRKE